MDNPLKKQLKQLIIDKLGLEDITPADIGDNTALFADDGLGLDSVDALELGLAIQKTFNFPMENDAKTLRETLDKLKDKLKTAAIVLAATSEGKVQLAAGVTPDTVGRIKAGELVNFVAQQVGGKGGGKPDMAMAGGTNAAALPQALQSVQGWVAAKLA